MNGTDWKELQETFESQSKTEKQNQSPLIITPIFYRISMGLRASNVRKSAAYISPMVLVLCSNERSISRDTEDPFSASSAGVSSKTWDLSHRSNWKGTLRTVTKTWTIRPYNFHRRQERTIQSLKLSKEGTSLLFDNTLKGVSTLAPTSIRPIWFTVLCERANMRYASYWSTQESMLTLRMLDNLSIKGHLHSN